MSVLYLAPDEDIGEPILAVLQTTLERTFGFPVQVLPPRPTLPDAFDAARRQFSSTAILRDLIARRPPDAVRLLGITGKDIFIPMLSFIFGQAQLGGRIALISLARLDQRFYQLPADPVLFFDRIAKEAIHELGHTFGLTHCNETTCAMSLSTNIAQVDAKAGAFCGACQTMLQDAIDALVNAVEAEEEL